jgi:hypothetical protein
MEFWAKVIAKLITGIMSIADASNLRNRMYELGDEHEIMWTALDDIARMHQDHPSGQYARDISNKIKNKYGRN